MTEVSERHHSVSQLGASAVAHPGGQEALPPPAPALYHLSSEQSPEPDLQATEQQHHHESQLGEAAVAPPSGLNRLPPPAPALHHLGDQHTFESQVGPTAIAFPNGDISHPDPIPAHYHLNEDGNATNVSPVKPFQYLSKTSDSPSPSLVAADGGRHTLQSQLGASAIAAPADTASLPPLAPELHHIRDYHTHETQLGQPAIAPSAELISNPWQNEGNETFPGLPPFPDDVATAPLLRISLKKLLNQDQEEINKVWTASRELGFFYLDLIDASSNDKTVDGPALLKDINALFSLGEDLFALPTAEKQQYDFADQGSYFGYKGIGAGVVDAKGTRDRNEFYNISKDDMLSISERLPAPELLQQQTSRDLLANFVKKSHAIVTLLLSLLNTKLDLPPRKLQSLHRLQAVSGDQVRWVNSPPQPEDDRKKALGEHTGTHHLLTSHSPTPTPKLISQTDFGTLTLLANRLGGLQILPPASEATPKPEWTYVRPLPSHLIVNLGDALVRFTSGILRSNIHRVVNPPGEQAGCKRMSLVYFSRPEDDVVLKPLKESDMIREAGVGKEDDGDEVTAKEWILRRALQRRVGGDWEKSEGTEGGRA